MIHCKYDELIQVDELAPHPKNPNKHSADQIERLAKLLEYHGWRSPIIVSNLSGCIVAGHGRLEAAKHMALTHVPVQYQDFENSDAEYAYVVSDNAIAEWSDLDLSAINMDMTDLGPDFDVDLLGIQDFEVEVADKLEPGCDEDDVPQEQADPQTVEGDIWKLGRHRLMCGDATNVQHLEQTLDGAKIDLVYTDPPYGMDLDTDYSKLPSTKVTGNKSYDRIIGDNEDFDPSFILGFFDKTKEIILWGADYYAKNLPKSSWYVWDKRVDENFDKMFGSAFELAWSKNKHKREIARVNNTLFSGEADARNKVHPTQKPIKLHDWVFERVKGDNVADLYGGSGSTLIACEKTDRTCYMMELEPKYVRVIIDRWEKYTGETAELLNGNRD